MRTVRRFATCCWRDHVCAQCGPEPVMSRAQRFVVVHRQPGRAALVRTHTVGREGSHPMVLVGADDRPAQRVVVHRLHRRVWLHDSNVGRNRRCAQGPRSRKPPGVHPPGDSTSGSPCSGRHPSLAASPTRRVVPTETQIVVEQAERGHRHRSVPLTRGGTGGDDDSSRPRGHHGVTGRRDGGRQGAVPGTQRQQDRLSPVIGQQDRARFVHDRVIADPHVAGVPPVPWRDEYDEVGPHRHGDRRRWRRVAEGQRGSAG